MNASPIRCLITAGPTREFFDPVRYISNPSSGKMGYALAAAARTAGWQVELISGPVALPAPEGVGVVPVVTGRDMLKAVRERFPACDILIKVAAVCDMRPKHLYPHKVKKDALSLTVEFEPVEDILKTVAADKRPGQIVVGFAAETQDVEEYARRKLFE
ncbi:MAG: phosphopantothenoylcysteine decarboxylase, partial [Verrucomicrobiota bacterium JB024]|nr:phosphopantothenoylcysteine decarboxylase [Verrucomicrobiota bacterium JB024]